MNVLVQNQRRSFLVLLLFLCLHTVSWGQVKADFTATPLSGCSPLVVYFSDSSTGNPTQWRWDLGNGVTSYLRNPSATYFNPGTYTVKLVASNASGKDSVVKSRFVTVYESPKADFSFDKSSGCFPLPVQFSDKSTPGSGKLLSWQWDFGDGTISSQQNPLHTFTTAGIFTITLRVTNSFGCVKSYTKEQAVTITNGVKASFTASDPGVCPAPASVQLTSTSTGPAPLRFLWNFGDGSSSTEASPSHTYNRNGTYSVSLIATSPQGCVDTVTKQDLFRIGTAKAAFSSPAALCVNSAGSFTTTTVPTPKSVQWNFGDGTTSTLLNPVKTYTRTGMYTVQLITSFGDCADTTEKQVTVADRPTVDFTAVQTTFCSAPATVNFTTSANNNNYSYTWDYGDSTKATTANPTHVYTKEGSYTVRLIVTNEGGCSDTLTKKDFIHIQKTQISVKGLPQKGCAPITINPSAVVAGNQSITGYLWSFGDGSTSTEATPTHTYRTAGNYDVRLITQTATGCSDTLLLTRTVRVGEKPHADFVNTPVTVCPFEKVSFTDKSTGTVDQWLWEFGDGGTATVQNPIHQYSDTGWQAVRLIVYSNTCPDTVVLKNAVYVNPPIANYSVQNDCNNKFTKKFTDKSLGAKTWFWEFGDGTTSTAQNPEHLYSATGTYNVKLTVTNGACTHSSAQAVSVIDETADFQAADSLVCRNSTATFRSSGINSSNIAGWVWNFGDGTSVTTAKESAHTYTKAGTYTVTLTITDLLGCKSTESRQVTVFGPTAAFQPSVAASCLKDNNVLFTESTTTDGQHSIVKRIWNFGDGTVDSSAVAPFRHSYTAANTYTVSLTVVDNFGCRDIKTQPAAVIIAQPAAAFTVSDTLTCTDKAIQFTNGSNGISPSYQWLFGDGKVSALANPSHAYTATGSYSIQLLVTDKFGCKDSTTKQDLVTISYPKAAFTVSDSVGTCPPLLVHFTNQSSNGKSLRWNFGDSSTSELAAPSHFYSIPGTYYATLVVTGPGGCTDTVRKKIVVNGPTGSFTYTPLTGCNPLTVSFKATTKNDAKFIWDFSDGVTEAGNSRETSHTYVDAGEFVPKIILTDAAGCTVPIIGEDTIRVKGVATAFEMNAATFCDNGVVQFTNQTVSNDLITGYRWNFGDGASSTDANPSHHYALPGKYTTTLQVTTQTGCVAEKMLTDSVKVYASPVVQITGDSTACAPALFSFAGEVKSGNPATLKWSWDFANGKTANLQQPEKQTYSTDGKYTITTTVTDEHGCRDTASKRIAVYPTPQTNAGADQWICRGSLQQLKATGATRYTWQAAASLSCTDCDGPLAAPTDSTQYIVTGSNSFGCSKSDSVVIRVRQPFTLSVGKGDTICAGATVRLLAPGADQYTWTPSLDVKNPSAGMTTATPQKTTLYTVVAKDNYNCFTDTGSVYVKVWSIPTVDVQDAQTLQVGNSLLLNPKYSPDVISYQWSNAQTLSCANCPTPTAKPKSETTYTIQVRNEGGCTAKDAVTVHVICNDGNVFIPNTFSPNGDGNNDRFYPRGTGISRIKSLKVFNRWGELVFDRENFNANDAAAGWDGSFKGQILTPDVYIYTCEVVCLNNEVLTYRGDVTLLR